MNGWTPSWTICGQGFFSATMHDEHCSFGQKVFRWEAGWYPEPETVPGVLQSYVWSKCTRNKAVFNHNLVVRPAKNYFWATHGHFKWFSTGTLACLLCWRCPRTLSPGNLSPDKGKDLWACHIYKACWRFWGSLTNGWGKTKSVVRKLPFCARIVRESSQCECDGKTIMAPWKHEQLVIS